MGKNTQEECKHQNTTTTSKVGGGKSVVTVTCTDCGTIVRQSEHWM